MQRLNESHSPALVLKQFRFLRIQLAGRPETAALHDEVKLYAEKLREAADKTEEAELLVQASAQKIEYLDERLDQSLSDLELFLLALVSKHKDDPRYVRIFGEKNLSKLKRLPYEDECQAVEGILQRLAEEEYASLEAQTTALRTALAELQAEMKARTSLELSAASLKSAESILLTSACKAYNQMEVELLVLFENKRPFVDTFFRKFKSSKKKQASEADETA